MNKDLTDNFSAFLIKRKEVISGVDSSGPRAVNVDLIFLGEKIELGLYNHFGLMKWGFFHSYFQLLGCDCSLRYKTIKCCKCPTFFDGVTNRACKTLFICLVACWFMTENLLTNISMGEIGNLDFGGSVNISEFRVDVWFHVSRKTCLLKIHNSFFSRRLRRCLCNGLSHSVREETDQLMFTTCGFED